MTAHTFAKSIGVGRSATRRAAKGPLALLERWAMVSAERRALAGADDALLKDLGLSRADAEREASRPFWDLPAGR